MWKTEEGLGRMDYMVTLWVGTHAPLIPDHTSRWIIPGDSCVTGPLSRPLCHSTPCYGASRDPLAYQRRAVPAVGISPTMRLFFHIPLDVLVFSLAPNEGVFVWDSPNQRGASVL